MQAFGIVKFGGPEELKEHRLPIPLLRPRDVLVRVVAVAMNPVDVKVRTNFGRLHRGPFPRPRVLGYDGAGVVEALGAEATRFYVGERVFFAGDARRSGTNAEYIAVDERIMALAPTSIELPAAASLPLVSLTAWEGLFEGAGLKAGDVAGQTILVLPGAGGVGSMAIQLAKKLLGLRVVAAASKPASAERALRLGADVVINHKEALQPQLQAHGIDGVHIIFSTHELEPYLQQFSVIIKPLGKIIQIIGVSGNVDLNALFYKRVNIVFELMFTRTMFNVEPERQGAILQEVARLVDNGTLLPLISLELPLSLDNLRRAHEMQEAGSTIGKVVLTRF